jgi:protein involved in polysaccharide export with SLBB domain
MKNFNRFFILLLALCSLTAQTALAQKDKGSTSSSSTSSSGALQTNSQPGYLIGLGDVIEIKVYGEEQLDGTYSNRTRC